MFNSFKSQALSKPSLFALALAAVIGLHSGSVFAAGYEKNIMWSGRHGGVGGAAVSFTEGSEALFWNPAGLLGPRGGQEVSLNVSPTFSSFKGSIYANNQNFSSKDTTTFPFGLIYSAALNEKFAFGIGGYVSGGTRAQYENVAFPAPFTLRPTIESEIILTELAIGGSYQVMEGLKIGAAWRAGFVNAKLGTATTATLPGVGLSLVGITLDDLEAEEFNGFKLGAQYRPSNVFGLGLSWRSELDFELEGNGTAQINPAAAPTTITTVTSAQKVKAKSKFPMQLTLGGDYLLEGWSTRLMLEYVFTQYSRVKTLDLTGTIGAIPLSDITQNWKDQHQVRFGTEYDAMAWPVRFGYVYTSQVVPDDRARATFSAPGIAHTVTLGTGKSFMEEALRVDAAIERSWISEDIGANTANGVFAGKYETLGTSIHLGLAYRF